MVQTAKDKYKRAREMLLEEGGTRNLSIEDKEALRHVLGMINAFASELAYFQGSTVPTVINTFSNLVEKGEQ